MRTSELSGAALDWAVAKAGGTTHIELVWETVRGKWSPSTNWAQGGAIIEREGISLLLWKGFTDGQYWVGSIDVEGQEEREREEEADTPLVAAMRAYVASKLGDEVQIPEGL